MQQLPFHGSVVQTGDILVVGRRIRPFFLARALWELPVDAFSGRVTSPRVAAELISWRIQMDTVSKWNHIEGLDTIGDTVRCIGAQSYGVREADAYEEFSLDKYRLCVLRPRVPVLDDDLLRVRDFLRGSIGRRYGLSKIWKIRWNLMTGGLAKLHAAVDSVESLRATPICSILLDQAYSTIDRDIIPHAKALVSPGDFLDSYALDKVAVWM